MRYENFAKYRDNARFKQSANKSRLLLFRGKPVIKGTRVPVELIIRKLGEGASFAGLLDGYPNLKKEDIQAALLCAATEESYADCGDHQLGV